jgi:acetyl esterase/lipase
MTDANGLPPLYMEVLEQDVFRDEDIEYARRTAASGVSTELHVHPAVPHAFVSAVARRMIPDRIRVLQTPNPRVPRTDRQRVCRESQPTHVATN